MTQVGNYDVIVIGGGIAGLTAAHILQREGQRVIVLEARQRIGGRIHTVTMDAVESCGWPEVTVDLGANYLHGCSRYKGQQPLFFLAHEIGVSSVVCASDAMGARYRGWEDPEMAKWRDEDTGLEISRKKVGRVNTLFDKMLRRAFEMVKDDPYMGELSLKNVFDMALRDLLVFQYKRGFRKHPCLSRRDRGIMESLMCRFFFFVNPGYRLSASKVLNLGYTEEDVKKKSHLKPVRKRYQKEHNRMIKSKLDNAHKVKISCPKKTSGPIEDRLVISGFSGFVEALGKNLNIQLSTVVHYVRVLRENSTFKNVAVFDRSGNEYHAHHCIVALPVGVLKGLDYRSRVDFDPPLPKAKLDAIKRLGLPKAGAATHDKIVMRFNQVFWDTNVPHLESLDPRVHILNLDFYGKKGVLMAHLWGGSDFQLEEKTDEEAVDIILDLLKGMYGYDSTSDQFFPYPVQYIVTRWSEDPFSLGAYTDDEHGSWQRDRATYAAPLPSKYNPILQFIGEATRDDESRECTDGAFMSGFEAAKHLLSRKDIDLRIPRDKIIDYLMVRYTPEAQKKRGRKNSTTRNGSKKRAVVTFSVTNQG